MSEAVKGVGMPPVEDMTRECLEVEYKHILKEFHHYYKEYMKYSSMWERETESLQEENEKLKAEIEHEKACRIGLWATDRPDLLTEEEREKCFLFEITK